ncbi:hypothetical protein SBV1_380002 [Verrucomicrobia bacterium]|nr:hypothetical protein SBV1_380002 [Verrucomicrobiota bacterium]
MPDQHFGGAPINAQNLSEWCQGGYREWLADQERRDVLRHIADQPRASKKPAKAPQ